MAALNINEHETYVTYDIAKLLKYFGFRYPCNTYYIEDVKIVKFSSELIDFNAIKDRYSAPTVMVALDFLQRKHGFDIKMIYLNDGLSPYYDATVAHPSSVSGKGKSIAECLNDTIFEYLKDLHLYLGIPMDIDYIENAEATLNHD